MKIPLIVHVERHIPSLERPLICKLESWGARGGGQCETHNM